MKVFITSFLILCASCDAGPSGNMSTMYPDSHIAGTFEKDLIENNIPFKRIENQFFYAIKNKDEVENQKQDFIVRRIKMK